jgi:hypothetical protein
VQPAPSYSIIEDLVAPTGGLAGTGAIANVGEGTFYTYVADALVGFAHAPLRGPVSDPDEPHLGSAQSQPPHGVIATVLDGNGEPLQIDYARGIDAVSAVFMADAIYNDFLVADALGANTDWIITFPTKQFYVDKVLYPATVTRPFSQPFTEGQSRLELVEDLYDREAYYLSIPHCGIDYPTCIAYGARRGYQVNVLAFMPPDVAESGVFGSKLVSTPLFGSDSDVDAWPGPEAGWMKLSLAPGDDDAHVLAGGTTLEGADVRVHGLPVTGFMAYNIINANAAPGRLANYGGTFRHRTHWSCVGDVAPCQ